MCPFGDKSVESLLDLFILCVFSLLRKCHPWTLKGLRPSKNSDRKLAWLFLKKKKRNQNFWAKAIAKNHG